MKQEMHLQSISDDIFLIGNDLSRSPKQTLGLQFMSHIDGMLGAHFDSFEEVEKNNNAKLNVTDLLFWFNVAKQIRNGTYGKNKILLMKGWIGPESSPINSFEQNMA